LKNKYLSAIIFIIAIADLLDFWPKYQLYLKFKSIFQLGEILSQSCEIVFFIFLITSILISSKKFHVILIGIITVLMGNLLHLSLDIYNEYFTLRNLLPRFGYIIMYLSILKFLIIKLYKKESKIFISEHIGFFSGLIASLVVGYEKVRAGIFESNIFSIHTLYGIGMVIIIVTFWIILSLNNKDVEKNFSE
jgi:hypothetical protein